MLPDRLPVRVNWNTSTPLPPVTFWNPEKENARLPVIPEPPLAALTVHVVVPFSPTIVLAVEVLPLKLVMPLNPPGPPPAIWGAAPVWRLTVTGPVSLA